MTFREIPCNKDIYYASVIPYLNNMEYHNDNIIGAMLLKFQKEKKIKIEKDVIKIIYFYLIIDTSPTFKEYILSPS